MALLRDAGQSMILRPRTLVDGARVGLADARVELAARASARAGRMGPAVRGVASVGRSVLRRPQASPLQVRQSEQRRLAISRTRLAGLPAGPRGVRRRKVNDVVLAVVAGALRGWLLSRAVPLRPASTVRALVPVERGRRGRAPRSLSGRGGAPGARGNPFKRVRPLLVDLPVGEPDPVLRLTQLRYAMASHRRPGVQWAPTCSPSSAGSPRRRCWRWGPAPPAG